MNSLVTLLAPVVDVLDMVIQLYIYVVIARALVSWVNPDPYNPVVRFLHNATEPVLERIRRLMPVQMGGLDLAPLILILLLSLLRGALRLLVFRVLTVGY